MNWVEYGEIWVLWESEKEGIKVLVKKYLLLNDFEKSIKFLKKHLLALGPVSTHLSQCQNENQEHCCPAQRLLGACSGVTNLAAQSLEPSLEGHPALLLCPFCLVQT